MDKSVKTRSILAAALLLIAGNPVHAIPVDPEKVYLGSVAMDVPSIMVEKMTPLAKYLSKKSGLMVSFRASPNLGSAVDELGKEFTQVAYLTPVAYLEAREKYHAIPLVAPLTRGKATFTLMIGVRKDSPIKTVQDLKGQRFAFGDEKALLQRAVVVGSGIKMEEFSKYTFLNHYDNIAKAVLNDDFQGGILKDTVAEEFEPRGLRVIYTSPPLPNYLFAVNDRLPPHVVAKLKAAFMTLKNDTPEGKAILKELDPGYEGFGEVSDKDYDIIRKLIAPFKK